MKWYPVLRSVLFRLNPEAAHQLTLTSLNFFFNNVLGRYLQERSSQIPIKVMGLNFPNPMGLAAGLDKNGECINGLAALGFGFIEIGTVTPKPQAGNPKPRLFRLTEANALINRMGFNNAGIEQLVRNVKQSKFKGILGINIGKNKDTPLHEAIDDYEFSLNLAYPHASYVTINISSPNTPGLRDLQQKDYLVDLLQKLKAKQAILAVEHQKYVPLVVKISPDLSEHAIEELAHVLLECRMDGVIATNTTISRDAVKNISQAEELGGLSGQPLFATSLSVVKQLSHFLQGKIPIIACGGISNAEQAKAMIEAGASLIQIYTGLIYQGPCLVNKILKAFK